MQIAGAAASAAASWALPSVPACPRCVSHIVVNLATSRICGSAACACLTCTPQDSAAPRQSTSLQHPPSTTPCVFLSAPESQVDEGCPMKQIVRHRHTCKQSDTALHFLLVPHYFMHSSTFKWVTGWVIFYSAALLLDITSGVLCTCSPFQRPSHRLAANVFAKIP